MKVFIGPYTQYHAEEEQERQVEVEIHDYDIWSLDHTLAKIIYPALLKFRGNLNSFPTVDPEEAPNADALTSKYSQEIHGMWDDSNLDDEQGGQEDSNIQRLREESEVGYLRWLHVLDEIIFSFHCLYTNNAWVDEYYERKASRDEINAMEQRISNGFKLFGKYYRNLWN